jgi:FdhE protein
VPPSIFVDGGFFFAWCWDEFAVVAITRRWPTPHISADSLGIGDFMNSAQHDPEPLTGGEQSPEIEKWLREHPYLAPIARFQREVEQPAADSAPAAIASPQWPAYVEDYRQGVPLLMSERAAVDRTAASKMLEAIASRLFSAPLPEALKPVAAAVDWRCQQSPGEPARIIDWALGTDSAKREEVQDPGFQRLLAWTAIRRAFGPVLEEFAVWRDEAARRDEWMLGKCPGCGALPAMSELVGVEAGRERRMVCSLCQSRWRYQRVGCPYCSNADPARLDILEIEQEPALRLESCSQCKGYWKTCVDAKLRSLLLQDWPTVHLDVLARERGLERKGASLYEF